MLNAKEANRIANNYQSEAKKSNLDYIEKSITARAKEGFKWFPWDYDFAMKYEGLTADEKQEIVFNLQSAGYDVKDHWFLKELVIRW